MTNFSTHPWMSGLLGDPEISKIFAAEAELSRYLQIEAAWTRSLGDVEGQSDAETIASAIETAKIDPSSLADGTARDGLPIPALVKALKSHVGPKQAHLVHRGLTSQDVIDTSLVMALREVFTCLHDRLEALDHQLATLQNQFSGTKLMAFTRMQPALETTGAEVIEKWRQPIPTILCDLQRGKTEIAQIQWGGPIGARDHADAKALGACFAQQLSLQDPGQAWHTDRTLVLTAMHVISRTAVALGKIGEDIALMAAIGPEQITISGGSSSAMPHKNNPVAAEVLIAIADQSANLQASLLRSARHESFRSGRAWTLEWMVIPQLCVLSGAAILRAESLISSVRSVGKGA